MIVPAISVAIVLPLIILFSFWINKKLAPKWDSREDYGYKGGQWKKPLIVSIIVSTIFTLIIATLVSAIYVSVSLGLLVFFLTATALTDAKTHLIPRELSNMALLVGLITGVIGFATAQYYHPEYLMNQSDQLLFQLINFGLFMFAVSLSFVVIMFSPVIGFGDIKMFWATGLFVGTFFAMPQMLMIFMLMFIIMGGQLLFRIFKAKSWKVSGGLPALPAFAVAFVTVILATNAALNIVT